jgi:GntR family transcriptional regulator, rspAB operon transcriptional repressor
VNASSPLADAPGSRSRISQPASAPRPTLVDVIALMPVDPHEPVGKRIFRALRQAIFVGAMAPGTPLSEKDVSELFHVSRQPVREAFIKLVELGVLQVLPQRGTFVKKISPRQVREGRFIRGVPQGGARNYRRPASGSRAEPARAEGRGEGKRYGWPFSHWTSSFTS